MFNKRDNEASDPQTTTRDPAPTTSTSPAPSSPAPVKPTSPAAGSGTAAVIGATVQIDGRITADEDLRVEGKVKGTITLKNNTLTIGSQGQVDAEVHAHTILVEGRVNGDLYAAERINIRASARIEGNLLAPRMSLEEGARFRGTVDMDPDSEALAKVFGKDAHTGTATTAASAPSTASRENDQKPDLLGAGNHKASGKP
ncbi:MAG: polymer-forming cytoskeletal protein [Wenzhouxiangellaceae bacterium]|nr:polymer-forming cytoskeletal protein [Wenzhouxiangellaceae bacterium]